VRLDYTPEQEQLRDEIRATMEQVMTPERQAAVSERMEGGPAVRDCVRALAAADLLGVGWPKEFGGRAMAGLGMPRAPRDLRATAQCATDKSGGSAQ
jgi:alkylation response protein AidB-like acyl-CoA dehydrogenase